MTERSETVFDPAIDEKMTFFLQRVLQENQKYNLTSIIDWEEAIVKHLKDSMAATLSEQWKLVDSCLDLGSGAGFPGIPLALGFPGKKFYLLEANKKKALFLRDITRELNITNVEILHGRAEEFGRSQIYREKMDMVTARAVASVNVLIELAFPLLKTNGCLAAYKGPKPDEELKNAFNAIKLLYSGDPSVIHYRLPGQFGERTLIVFQKKQPTPEIYPRRTGVPEKRPL